MNDLGWESKSIVLFLDDGSYLLSSTDDEGNGPGALFTNIDGLESQFAHKKISNVLNRS